MFVRAGAVAAGGGTVFRCFIVRDFRYKVTLANARVGSVERNKMGLGST